MEYWKAEEVEEIADRYMKYHSDLVGANVAFIFQEKATKQGGKPLVGRVSKVPLKYRVYMEKGNNGEPYDFLITIGYDAWQELNQTAREAWVDYLLEHCYGKEKDDGSIVWHTRTPEVQVFTTIVNRHGSGWDHDLHRLSTITSEDEVVVGNTNEDFTPPPVNLN
jgi:hypothetical protein